MIHHLRIVIIPTLALILPFLACNITDAVARQIWF